MRRLITPIFFACLLLLATAGFSAYGQEQSHYRTLKLESLAEQLAAKGIRLETEGLYPADKLCPGKQVEMAQDIFGRVGFIGLHLFDAGMQQEPSNWKRIAWSLRLTARLTLRGCGTLPDALLP